MIDSRLESFIEMMRESEERAYSGFQLLIRKDFKESKYFDALKKAKLFEPPIIKKITSIPAEVAEFEKFFQGALRYLELVAKQAGKNNDNELADKVVHEVRRISQEFKDSNPKEHYCTLLTFTKILASVPTSLIQDNDIELIALWINSDFHNQMTSGVIVTDLLPKLLESTEPVDWDKAAKVLQHCLKIKSKEVTPDKIEFFSIIGDYCLKELLKNNINLFSEKCPEKAARIFQKNLQEVFEKKEEILPSCSWIIRPAIEDHSQNYEWYDVINCFVGGLRDIANTWLKKDTTSNAKKFVSELLNSRLGIERRIALYLINSNFELLKDLLDKAIPLLNENEHLHEMSELLKNNFKVFSDNQKNKVIETILKSTDSDIHQNVIIKKISQRNWFNAIKDQGSSKADELFRELNSDTQLGKVSSHPNFICWREHWINPSLSPYKTSEILYFLNNKTLISKLNSFVEPLEFSVHKPTIAALVDTLEETIIKEPLKFIVVLEEFQRAKRPYQFGILNGLKKLWDATDSKDISSWDQIWKNLLLFMQNLLDENFWNEVVEESNGLTPNKNWIPPLIAEFLRATVNKDEKSLPSAFQDDFLGLINNLLENLPSKWLKKEGNSFNQAINSSKGKAIEALVDYALFTARLADRQQNCHQVAWRKVEPIFIKQLDLCKGGNFEFSTLMGACFSNLEYLSPEFLEKNVNDIFPINRNDNFLCALQGFAYASDSKTSYILLKDKGIIQEALKRNDAHTRKNLLQRISLAYIHGDELLDSENIQYLFNIENVNDLTEMAKFFGNIKSQYLNDDQIQRVSKFWEKIINQINSFKEPQKLLGALGLFISCLNNISNEQTQWLLKSVPYLDKYYQIDPFLAELERLVSISAKAVKDILVKLLETYHPINNYNGKLEKIIRKIHTSGLKNEALSLAGQLAKIEGFPQLYKELKESL